MEELCAELNQLKGISCEVKQDETGREIYRVSIKVENSCCYITDELLNELQSGDPAIYLRSHQANTGVLFVDPRPLKSNDMASIISRFKELLSGT